MITQALVLVFSFIVLRGDTIDSPLLKATSTGSGALKERGAWRVRLLPQDHQGMVAEPLQPTVVKEGKSRSLEALWKES